MGALLVLLRSTRRVGGRGLIVLALVIGLAGGVVLTGIAAARRTSTAFDRLVEETEAWDVLANPDLGNESALQFEDVAALPMVEDAGRVDGVLLVPRVLRSFDELETGPTVMASDGRAGYDFARPLVREGRFPAADAVDEIFMSAEAAEVLGLEAGDLFEARILAFDDFASVDAAESEAEALEVFNSPDTGRLVDLEVVGTGPPFDEVVVDEGFGGGTMLLSPAFYEHFDQPTAGYWGSLVRLREGVPVEEFEAAVEALVPDEPLAFQTRESVEDQADRAVRPYVEALTVFALLAGVVVLVVVAQAISRRLQADARTLAPLGALGVTSGQRALLGVTRIAFASVVGGVLAVVFAVLASPIAPIGVARDAEPDLGIRIDLPVLVAGGLVVAVVFTVLAIRPAIVSARRSDPAPVRSGLASRVAGLGLSPTAVTATRFAFDRSTVGVPARSTLLGAATSIALVVATVAFSSNLDHFVDSTELYGTPWDAVVDIEGVDDPQPDDFEPVAAALAGHDEVNAYGLLYPGQLRVEGHSLPAVSLDSSDRPIVPTMLDGRPPVGPTEIALGSTTMDDLGLEVGDRVTVTRRGRDAELTIVGTAVLPAIGAYSGADKTTLGEGALASHEVLLEWGPEFDPYGVVVDLDDPDAATALAEDLEVPPPYFLLSTPASVPSDVESLERVQSTPLILTGMLAALIALTVIHALMAAVRSRRRELAVLRTFGFTRRQVVASVTMQALLIAAVGLLVGVPLGLVLGRVAWTARIDRLGAVIEMVTPVLVLAGLGVAVFAMAALVAIWPGLRAARAHPATILRTE